VSFRVSKFFVPIRADWMTAHFLAALLLWSTSAEGGARSQMGISAGKNQRNPEVVQRRIDPMVNTTTCNYSEVMWRFSYRGGEAEVTLECSGKVSASWKIPPRVISKKKPWIATNITKDRLKIRDIINALPSEQVLQTLSRKLPPIQPGSEGLYSTLIVWKRPGVPPFLAVVMGNEAELVPLSKFALSVIQDHEPAQ